MYANTPEVKPEESFKTPMWQVNQLANHHKMKHEYRLEKEEGHFKSKRFTMSLHIGEEIWVGSGTTKKEAKRNASEAALKGTALSPPPENQPNGKKVSVVNQNALTPTVKLNGMAMVHAKKVTYTVIGKKYSPPVNNHTTQLQHPTNWNAQQHQMFGSRYISQDVRQQVNLSPINQINPIHQAWQPGTATINPENVLKGNRNSSYFKYYQGPCRFTVCVTVGEDKFYGEGSTQQAARHDAAGRAIIYLQSLPVVPKSTAVQNGTENGYRKSFVSILYEEALPRDMNVVFKMTDERGPPHLRYYTLEVTVGFFVDDKLDEERPHYHAVADGTSKKAAKQKVAGLILEKMTDLPPRVKGKKRKERQAVTEGGSPPKLHPVSRLLQIAQAQKIEEPKYKLIELDEASITPDTKFAFQCSLDDKSVTGYGKSKKEAKRNTANAMLSCIGYLPTIERAVPNLNMIPQKTSLKQESQEGDAVTKHLQVQFTENAMVNIRKQEYIAPVSFS